jgi:carboxymethylenebutenolidase
MSPVSCSTISTLYVHGGMDRRTFIDRCSRYVVGGLTATALFEALAPNYA